MFPTFFVAFRSLSSVFISLAKAIIKRHDPTAKLKFIAQFKVTKNDTTTSMEKASMYPNGVLQSNANLEEKK